MHQLTLMDKLITEDKIKMVISKMKVNTEPGPDGLTIEFY